MTPKRKYVKGSFLLENHVTDLESYYRQHKTKIDEVAFWADDFHGYVAFGISESDIYLCEYEFLGYTAQLCKGMAAELKGLLKSEWKHARFGYQVWVYTY